MTFVIKPQNWLFYVVVLQTTAQKWTKVKNARAGRAKLLFLPTKYANFVTFSFSYREFKKRRRLRQRQRQKAVILLLKRGKMLVLHVRHAFLNISLPYWSKLLREMTKFKVLTTTWTTTVNLSVSLFTSNPSVPIQF